jgi:hypothetical protein
MRIGFMGAALCAGALCANSTFGRLTAAIVAAPS